jgi:type II secretory pathway component PulC
MPFVTFPTKIRKSMKKLFIQSFIMSFIIVFSVVFLSSFAFSVDKNIQIKKQPEIQQVKPKKPVKIKLKRSAEGKYTWELSGDDVDEIVKADKRLKKLLNTE